MTEVYTRELTPQEIAEREQWAVEQSQLEKVEEQRDKARKSALKKLEKLGLTEDEVKAVFS